MNNNETPSYLKTTISVDKVRDINKRMMAITKKMDDIIAEIGKDVDQINDDDVWKGEARRKVLEDYGKIKLEFVDVTMEKLIKAYDSINDECERYEKFEKEVTKAAEKAADGNYGA